MSIAVRALHMRCEGDVALEGPGVSSAHWRRFPGTSPKNAPRRISYLRRSAAALDDRHRATNPVASKMKESGSGTEAGDGGFTGPEPPRSTTGGGSGVSGGPERPGSITGGGGGSVGGPEPPGFVTGGGGGSVGGPEPPGSVTGGGGGSVG